MPVPAVVDNSETVSKSDNSDVADHIRLSELFPYLAYVNFLHIVLVLQLL